MPHCSSQFQISGHKHSITFIQKNEIRHSVLYGPIWIGGTIQQCFGWDCWTHHDVGNCTVHYGHFPHYDPSLVVSLSQTESSSTWSVWLDSSLMTARNEACGFQMQFRAEFDRNEDIIQGRLWAFHVHSGSTESVKQDEPDFMKYFYGLSAWQ